MEYRMESTASVSGKEEFAWGTNRQRAMKIMEHVAGKRRDFCLGSL